MVRNKKAANALGVQPRQQSEQSTIVVHDPVAAFFKEYNFEYDPRQSAADQFHRMCEDFRNIAKAKLHAAIQEVIDREKEKEKEKLREEEQRREKEKAAFQAKQTAKKSSLPINPNNPLAAFFAEYAYAYTPNEPVMEQFYAMCVHFGWKSRPEHGEPDPKQEARTQLNAAISKEFNAMYGSRIDRLPIWHGLCRELGVDPLPPTIAECKAVVKSVHVNIIDLIDCRRTGNRVEPFDTEEELATYSRDTGKIFPRGEAHAGNLLQFLLRRIYQRR